VSQNCTGRLEITEQIQWRLCQSIDAIWENSHSTKTTLTDSLSSFFRMESHVMSDHQLKFKGPGFDFDAKGWLGIAAAIVIFLLLLFVPTLFY
jgi:hypothetical protein